MSLKLDTLKKINNLKIAVFVILAVFIYYLFMILNENKNIEHFEKKITGNFCQYKSKSKNVVLKLYSFHQFSLSDRIENKFYGNGNWTISIDKKIIVTLDFENGDSLILQFLPKDNILISCDNLNAEIKFKKLNTIN